MLFIHILVRMLYASHLDNVVLKCARFLVCLVDCPFKILKANWFVLYGKFRCETRIEPLFHVGYRDFMWIYLGVLCLKHVGYRVDL